MSSRRREPSTVVSAFFPPSFDVGRGFGSDEATSAAAYYDLHTKTVMLVGEPGEQVLVHELVHTLQDQHFDFLAIDEGAPSNDERLARRAVVEGDARLAELRWASASAGYDPLVEVAPWVSFDMARRESELALDASTVPLNFVSYQTFTYPYGTSFVARKIGLPAGRWQLEGSNEVFRGAFPASTQEVLQVAAGKDVDPIVDVGLARLPTSLEDQLHVRWQDHLGQWLVQLLLRPVVGTSWEISDAWDGDQVLIFESPDSTLTGLSWITAWDTADAASQFASVMVALHRGEVVRDDEPRLMNAQDGEPFWIEQHDTTVAFVKNLGERQMQAVAAQAFFDRSAWLASLKPVPHRPPVRPVDLRRAP